ncbi:MAG: CHAT domain-containing protein [Chloroflexi bacterium]|nr:MAG: CHAT domain-containing protein [Chloroflexota bacterium]
MAITTYQNFDLLITRSGDDYRAFVVDAPGGDADSVFALPFTADELDFLGDLAGVRRGGTGTGGAGSVSDLKELGGLLYGAIFQGKMAAVLATSLEKAEQEQIGLRLRLRFSEETSELATLPWEILYDPVQERFLALSESSPILRYLSLPKARPTLLVKPPLRVLAVLVSPPGHDELDVAREWQVLETALAGLVADGKFILEQLESPTFAALQERLLGEDVHILHFVGHGVYNESSETGALVLANGEGNAQEVSGEELATLLHNHRSLRLVYLNACEGALSSHLSVFSGVAQTLVQQGVPAAVAMQAEISDEAAIDLSRLFYSALAAGYPVDAALTQARVAIAARSAEWAIPVLFSRSPDNRLFDVVEVLPAPDCPYPGMVPFTEKQADVFFGRDKEIADAIERLRQHPFLTVIGPSGSGKSSLVYAGVIPALRKSKRFGGGEWDVRILRPGTKPLTSLAESLNTSPEQLAAKTFDQRTLLFVDQFEEIFTLAEAGQAQPFLDTLNALIGRPNLYILITVRADFYPDLMACTLWQPIRANRLELTPLGDEELRAAILQPAAQVGVTIDEVLAERLVGDAAGESGALPLVQEALVLLWEKVERRHLALSAYAEMAEGNRNGLQVAIDRRATTVYNNLPEAAQPIARRIFLRLVQFGEGRLDTRRQQTVDELRASGDDSAVFDKTLDKLTANRLLTTSGEEGSGRRVDIAHEALIGGWGLLRKWIGERRTAEQTRRRLEESAIRYVELERQGGLLDERELADAQDWTASPDSRELGISAELDALIADSRRALRKAALIRYGSLAAIVGLIVIAALVAWLNSRNADARHMASQSRDLRVSEPDTSLLLSLAALGREVSRQPEVDGSLVAALQCCSAQLQRFLGGHKDRVWSIATGRNGLTISGSDDGTVMISDIQSGKIITSFLHSELGAAVYSVSINPDETILATGGADHTVVLRRLSDWTPLGKPLIAHSGGVLAIGFSPDGYWMATAGADKQVLLWEVGELEQMAQTPPTPHVLGSHTHWVWDVSFSGDSKTLASIGRDEKIIVWDMYKPISQTLDFGWTGTSLVFGGKERNRLLVAGGANGRLALFDMKPWLVDREAPETMERRSRGSSTAWGLDISPVDENKLVTGMDSSSGFAVVKFWQLPDPDVEESSLTPLTLGFHGHSRGIFDVKFTTDGTGVVGGGQDGLLSLWQVSEGESIRRFPSSIKAIAVSGQSEELHLSAVLDGEQPVIETIDNRQRITRELGLTSSRFAFDSRGQSVAGVTAEGLLWLSNITEQTTLTQSIEISGAVESIEIGSPTNRGPGGFVQIVAVGDSSGRVHLWTPATDTLRVLKTPTVGKVTSLAFAPQGTILAIGTCEQILIAGDPSNCTVGSTQLWDVNTLQQTGNSLRARSGYVSALAYSADGRWLAAGTEDNVITLWEMPEGQERFFRPSVSSYGVQALAFSPNGKLLASGSGSSRVQLWQVPTGQPFGDSYPDHDDTIVDLAFSPDGARLFSASTDRTVVIHDLDTQRLVREACQMAGRSFTEDENERYLGWFTALIARVTGWNQCPNH